MSATLNCIMLIDDNKIDNFFHERVIKKCDAARNVITKESGREALDYITDEDKPQPELIFLDINMPGMNGWEFIEVYKRLDAKFHKSMIVVMLTTSENPDDIDRAMMNGLLADFKSKPLTREMLESVIEKYWDERT
jgi:CheY-like chemotaxis protein